MMSNLQLVSVPLAGLVGLGFGLAYFAAMRRSVAAFVAGGGWLQAGALTLCRLAVAAAGFGLAAQFGAAVLLAAAAGFLGARSIALCAKRRAG